MNNLKRHIFLIGFMGTGKSVVSKDLGKLMHLKVLDIDALIVETSGQSIPQIFEQKGELYFRQLETKVLQEVSELESSIISCGGGLPLKIENQEIMKKVGKVVLLTASAENIYKRVKEDNQRPLLKDNMNEKYIEDLMAKRRAAYETAANLIVETDNKNIVEICEEILLRLK